MQILSQFPIRKHLAAGIFAASLLSLAAPSLAQLAPPQPRQQSMGGETDRELLNSEQAKFARNQLALNAASQAEYERGLAAVEAAKAKIAADDAAARAAYAAETARVQAEAARIKADHAAAMAKWESDVAACRAGNYSRCSGG